MIVLSAQVDVSGLNEAIAYAQRWSSRSPAKCVNSTAIAVLVAVEKLTPFVPISRMDEELGTQIYYKNTPTGRKSTSARNRQYKGGKMVTLRDGREVSLAVMIILARANLTRMGRETGQSNYNRITNNRWALDPGEFRNRNIPAYVHRMISARHSSSKFLISGWVEAKRAMRGAPVAEPTTFDASTGEPIEEDLGRATPAREGDVMAVCVIENLVGMGNSLNAENYNQALMQHGLGPLQQAIDDEALSKFEHVANKLLERELIPQWDRLNR